MLVAEFYSMKLLLAEGSTTDFLSRPVPSRSSNNGVFCVILRSLLGLFVLLEVPSFHCDDIALWTSSASLLCETPWKMFLLFFMMA